MEEGGKKKIVFVIGNGYDLNLGRKTSFANYWESADCPKNYPAPIIHYLNQKFSPKGDSVRWYDLENELFNYHENKIGFEEKPGEDVFTARELALLKKENLESEYPKYLGPYDNEFQSLVHKHYITNDPKEGSYEFPYLSDIQLAPVERDRKAVMQIKRSLQQYLNGLPRDENTTGKFAHLITSALIESANTKGDILDVYNFNYTDLPSEMNYELQNNLHYVHGRLKDNNIIIGTREDDRFGDNYFYLQKSIDDNYNPPPIVEDLQNADDIIFFGHSLGKNDSQYFKDFFVTQSSSIGSSRKRITIFTWDNTSKVEIKRSLQWMTNYNLSSLYTRNEVEIIPITEMQKNRRTFIDFLLKYLTETDIIRNYSRGIDENQG